MSCVVEELADAVELDRELNVKSGGSGKTENLSHRATPSGDDPNHPATAAAAATTDDDEVMYGLGLDDYVIRQSGKTLGVVPGGPPPTDNESVAASFIAKGAFGAVFKFLPDARALLQDGGGGVPSAEALVVEEEEGAVLTEGELDALREVLENCLVVSGAPPQAMGQIVPKLMGDLKAGEEREGLSKIMVNDAHQPDPFEKHKCPVCERTLQRDASTVHTGCRGGATAAVPATSECEFMSWGQELCGSRLWAMKAVRCSLPPEEQRALDAALCKEALVCFTLGFQANIAALYTSVAKTDSEGTAKSTLIMLEFVPGTELTDLICTKNNHGTLMYDFSGPLYRDAPVSASSFEGVASTLLSIVYQTAVGLSYMHEKLVLHQDIKPDNIVVVRRPEENFLLVKIVDFGLAEVGANDHPIQQLLYPYGGGVENPHDIKDPFLRGLAANRFAANFHKSDFTFKEPGMFAQYGGCTPSWQSPEVAALRRELEVFSRDGDTWGYREHKRKNPLEPRMHDLWSFSLVFHALFSGKAPKGGAPGAPHSAFEFAEECRGACEWDNAQVLAWLRHPERRQAISKVSKKGDFDPTPKIEELGLSGAQLLRLTADDLKATFGLKVKIGQKRFLELIRRLERYPVPRPLVGLLGEMLDSDWRRRPRSVECCPGGPNTLPPNLYAASNAALRPLTWRVVSRPLLERLEKECLPLLPAVLREGMPCDSFEVEFASDSQGGIPMVFQAKAKPTRGDRPRILDRAAPSMSRLAKTYANLAHGFEVGGNFQGAAEAYRELFMHADVEDEAQRSEAFAGMRRALERVTAADGGAVLDLNRAERREWRRVDEIDVAGLAALTTLDLQQCFDGEALDLSGCSSLTAVNMRRAGRQFRRLEGLGECPLRRLNLEGCRGLEPGSLGGLPATLEELDLGEVLTSHDAEAFALPSGLACLTALRRLNLSGRFVNGAKISDISFASACTALKCLTLRWCCYVEDLSSIASLSQLEELDLSECNAVKDIACLGSCTALRRLSLDGMTSLGGGELAALAGCRELTYLNLGEIYAAPNRFMGFDGVGIDDLSALSSMPRLATLDLHGCAKVSDVSPLAACTALTDLDLSRCYQGGNESNGLTFETSDGLADISPLSACAGLTRLNLQGCAKLADIAPLSACVALTELDISSTRRMREEGGVVGVSEIASHLSSCTALTSLFMVNTAVVGEEQQSDALRKSLPQLTTLFDTATAQKLMERAMKTQR